MCNNINICEMSDIFKIGFIIVFICSNSFIPKYLKTFYDNNELKWHNDSININSVKNEILYYQNFTNLSLSTFNLKNIQNTEQPKISLIVPVYNSQDNLINFYMSVYNQSLTDIEIIFINDASNDTSTKIIEEIMLKDKRIIYINNTNQIREFFSKKKGVLKSKGEYILILEPDDLLLNNILEKSYTIAKKNNLDILQYYLMVGSYKNNRLWKNIKCNKGIIKYPKIEKFFFNCRYFNLLDKLIKRDIFINSLKDMTRLYNSDEFDEISDDDLAFFAMAKKAKSYGFFEEIGYFYKLTSSADTGHFTFLKKTMNNKWNEIFLKLFKTMNYFFVKTKNNREQKFWVFKFFYNKVYNYRNKLIFINKHFDFFNEVLNKFLECSLFSQEEKQQIKKFKKQMNDIKMKLEQ